MLLILSIPFYFQYCKRILMGFYLGFLPCEGADIMLYYICAYMNGKRKGRVIRTGNCRVAGLAS